MNAQASADVTPLDAPLNTLCIVAHPTDVIYAARAVLKFLHSSQPTDGDEEDQEYLDGKQYVWGMIQDALGFAKGMTEQYTVIPKVQQ